MNWKAALALTGGAILVYFLFKEQAKAAASAVVNVNQGTPYEGTGVIGTLGNATDALSGRQLSRFGSYLGGLVYDLTHRE